MWLLVVSFYVVAFGGDVVDFPLAVFADEGVGGAVMPTTDSSHQTLHFQAKKRFFALLIQHEDFLDNRNKSGVSSDFRALKNVPLSNSLSFVLGSRIHH